jgi:hypothetical protein
MDACSDNTFAFHASYGGKCFDEELRDDKNGNFGWTIGPLGPGTYPLPLYMGATDCERGNDPKIAGQLSLQYTGVVVKATFTFYEGYNMKETHIYVGGTPYPTYKEEPTGDYQPTGDYHKYTAIHELEGGATTDVFIFDHVSKDDNNKIYIIAHATSCGVEAINPCGCVCPDAPTTLAPVTPAPVTPAPVPTTPAPVEPACKDGPDILTETRYGLPSLKYKRGDFGSNNPHCDDFGYDYGVKINGCKEYQDTKFTSISTPTGQCASGLTDAKVDVDCKGKKEAKITPDVDVVVKMKGGPGGTLYYVEAGDTVTLDIGPDRKDISHMQFCFVCDGCNGGTARRLDNEASTPLRTSTRGARSAASEEEQLSELRGAAKDDPSSRVQCRVAYAYHSAKVSKSFQELGFSEGTLFDNTDITFGWTNGPLETSNYAYSFEMYSADKAMTIGTMTVTYDDEAMVIIEAGERLWLKSVNAYVGHSRLPVGEDSMEIIDPAQFPVAHEKMALSRSFTVSELDGSTPIYVVAEATICGVFAPTEQAETKTESVLGSVGGYLKKFL